MVIWKNHEKNCFECGIKSVFLEKNTQEKLELHYLLRGKQRSKKALKLTRSLNGEPTRSYIKY